MSLTISQSVGHDLTCSIILLGLEILSEEKYQINILREKDSKNVSLIVCMEFLVCIPFSVALSSKIF